MLSLPLSWANGWLLGYRFSSTLPLLSAQSTTPAASHLIADWLLETQFERSVPAAQLIPCRNSRLIKFPLQTGKESIAVMVGNGIQQDSTAQHGLQRSAAQHSAAQHSSMLEDTQCKSLASVV